MIILFLHLHSCSQIHALPDSCETRLSVFILCSMLLIPCKILHFLLENHLLSYTKGISYILILHALCVQVIVFFLIIRKYDLLSLYRASIREVYGVDSHATDRWCELRNTHKNTIITYLLHGAESFLRS